MLDQYVHYSTHVPHINVLSLQGNAFWRLVRNLLKDPSKEQVDCQQPKPILLDTGEMKKPYDWAVSYHPVKTLLSFSHKDKSSETMIDPFPATAEREPATVFLISCT